MPYNSAVIPQASRRPLRRHDSASSTPQSVLVKWWIVLRRSGKHYLYYLELAECLSGREVMCHILRVYYSEGISLASWTWHWFHAAMIDTAKVEWVGLNIRTTVTLLPTLPDGAY